MGCSTRSKERRAGTRQMPAAMASRPLSPGVLPGALGKIRDAKFYPG